MSASNRWARKKGRPLRLSDGRRGSGAPGDNATSAPGVPTTVLFWFIVLKRSEKKSDTFPTVQTPDSRAQHEQPTPPCLTHFLEGNVAVLWSSMNSRK